MNITQLELAENKAFLRYKEALKVADTLAWEWALASRELGEAQEKQPVTAMQWIRSEGIAMFGEVN